MNQAELFIIVADILGFKGEIERNLVWLPLQAFECLPPLIFYLVVRLLILFV